jgi:hypothetical protein
VLSTSSSAWIHRLLELIFWMGRTTRINQRTGAGVNVAAGSRSTYYFGSCDDRSFLELKECVSAFFFFFLQSGTRKRASFATAGNSPKPFPAAAHASIPTRCTTSNPDRLPKKHNALLFYLFRPNKE